LNEIAAGLNRHEGEIRERAERVQRELQEEIAGLRSESVRRHDTIGERIEQETRSRFAERKREGIIFAGGLALQGAGAVVLLLAC
jgi:hypothetical protein